MNFMVARVDMEMLQVEDDIVEWLLLTSLSSLYETS